MGLMREPVFAGGSPLPRVHIFRSKSDREPADTRLSCISRKQIKCLAGEVEKNTCTYYSLMSTIFFTPVTAARRPADVTTDVTRQAIPRALSQPVLCFDFFFPFFSIATLPNQMFNGYAIVSCIMHFWYIPLHMNLFNYEHKWWFNYRLCIFVLACSLSVMFSTSHLPLRCF